MPGDHTLPGLDAFIRVIEGTDAFDADAFDRVLRAYQAFSLDSITQLSRLCFTCDKSQPGAVSDRSGKADLRATHGLPPGQEMIDALTRLQHAWGKNVGFVATHCVVACSSYSRWPPASAPRWRALSRSRRCTDDPAAATPDRGRAQLVRRCPGRHRAARGLHRPRGDPVKGDVPTIGFGTTTDVKLGDTTTPPKALARALTDVQQFEGALKQCVTVPLAQHEYDAYVSLAYNIGGTRFCQSTLVKKLNTEDYAGACAELLRWRFFQGKDCALPVNARLCNDPVISCSGATFSRSAR